METPHVVVIGGGFGGLYAARTLARVPVRVTVVDRRNHHLFQPLLYQVATAALNPSDIAYPIRSVLRRQKNTRVLLGNVLGIDATARTIHLDVGELAYDYCIVATGATHSYFGHDEWETRAPGLKTIEDALEIRRRVLYAFEAAEREARPEARRSWLTFVIVGAGPTGVEVAGTLAEVAHHTLARDFRHIDPAQARVILVEGAPRVLTTYPPELSEKAQRQLEHLGVHVRLGCQVTKIDASGVTCGGEQIEARTVIWGAGVRASPLGKSLGAPLDRVGRVQVTPYLTVPGHDELLVIGDLAAAVSDGKPVPGVAPAAMQMGRYAARSIARTIAGKPREPFHYRDKGSLATIGRKAGIADFGRVRLSGFLAWLAWLLIHIFFLIGFRNRVLVLIEWAWAYVTYERGARLITGEVPPPAEAGVPVKLAPDGAAAAPPAPQAPQQPPP
jgi:NADH dehydrogenase